MVSATDDGQIRFPLPTMGKYGVGSRRWAGLVSATDNEQVWFRQPTWAGVVSAADMGRCGVGSRQWAGMVSAADDWEVCCLTL